MHDVGDTVVGFDKNKAIEYNGASFTRVWSVSETGERKDLGLAWPS